MKSCLTRSNLLCACLCVYGCKCMCVLILNRPDSSSISVPSPLALSKCVRELLILNSLPFFQLIVKQPSATLSLRRTVPSALALSLTRARSQSADRTGTQPLLLPEEALETD